MRDPILRRDAGGRRRRRAPALLAALAILALVPVACSQESQDAVRSAAAARSSVSVPTEEPGGGGGETQEPIPTEAPAPTLEPAEPSPAKDKNKKKNEDEKRWWAIAILVALIALVVALVVRGRSGRPAAVTWASRANETYAKAAALHDRLVALGTSLASGPAPAGRESEVERMIDDVAAALYALDADAPGEAQRSAITGLSTSLSGVRSATDLVFATSGTGGDPQVAASTLNGRLVDLEAALRVFRASI